MVAAASWVKSLSKEEIREVLEPYRHPFEIACHSTCNYFNFGTILRVGHNFLCRKLWAIDMDNGFYKKASMGAKKYEEIEKCTLHEFLEKNYMRSIVAFECRPDLESVPLYDFKWPENPIMFFGSEKFGVPEAVLKIANSVVSIPVQGVLNDFNVGVAAGIAVYDWVSKNTKKA